MTSLTLPELQSAKLIQWLVVQGDAVEQGQPIAIILDDQAEWVIGADQTGTISEFVVAEGATIADSQLVRFGPVQHSTTDNRTSASVHITPVARAIANQHTLDLATIHGTGVNGRICKHDVLALIGEVNRADADGFCVAEQMGNALHANEPTIRVSAPPVPQLTPQASSAAKQPSLQHFTPEQVSQIAERNQVNRETPQSIVAVVVDMSRLEHNLAQLTPDFARRGLTLTSTALLVAILADVVQRHRHVLGRWYDSIETIQRANLTLRVEFNMYATVLAHVHDLNLRGITRALTQAPADGKPSLTLVHSPTNWWSAPTLGVDQVALLHVGATQKQVVVRTVNGIDQTLIVPQAIFTLVYDARLLTDDQAEQFLADLKVGVEG